MSHARVFISYAKEDASTAKTLSEALQRAGLSVWWDRHIPPGKTWDEVIGRELDSAACVVVLWSKASVESRWVREEADRAARRGCLIPALVEKVDLPFGFGRLEAADLTEWHGDETHPGFLDLRAAVSELVKSGDLREQRAAVEEPPRPVRVPPKAPRRLPWIAAGAALVLVVAVVISQYVPFKPPEVRTEERLQLTVTPAPPSVSAGERTRIVVSVVDAGGAPVQGAKVTVSARGGRFLGPDEPFDPRSALQSPLEATGVTDQGGTYATGWVCNPCAGGYGMSAEATKPGFLGATVGFEVRVSAGPFPRDPRIPLEARPAKPDLGARTPVQPRPTEEPLRVIVRPEPPSVSAGERTRIVVSVVDPAGAPVPGAEVTVSAGGGKFLRPDEPFDPRSTLQSPYTAAGVTDQDGAFATGWVCNPCAGGYGMSAEATKRGFLGAKAGFEVGVPAGPVPRDPGIPLEARPAKPDLGVRTPGQPRPTEEPLRLTVRVEPPSVSVGERTTVVVRVVNVAGAPVPGAEVTVSAGGGKFLRPDEPFDPGSTLQSPYRATGITDQEGAFATGWVCNPCAGGYGMSAEATKPGFLGAKVDFDVRIRR